MRKVKVICNTGPLIGVVGLLCLAKNEGLIHSVKKDLDKLRQSGYYISDKLYQEVLKKVKEVY